MAGGISRGCLSALAALCVMAAACHGEDGEVGVVSYDSAGVQIVESRHPAWSEDSGWRLDREPLLQIGLADGPPEYQFSQVEAAIRLPDDRVVVADGAAQELRFFDLTGRFLGSVGRRGDAPGEYRRISALGYGPGDSIWVYDYASRRFTVLDGQGKYVRNVNLGGWLSNVGAVGWLRDGSFVVREHWSTRAHLAEIRAGLSRDPVAVAKISADGERLDTIGLFLGREVFVGSESGRPVMSAPLFARDLSATIYGDAIVIGEQEVYEIALYSPQGALQRLVRLSGLDLRLRSVDVERLKGELLAEGSEAHRAMLRAHIDATDVPETRPAFGELLSDGDGNLWVAEYAPYPRDPSFWRVFDAGGRLLGSVRMPSRFRLRDVNDGWLLGVWRDEIGVEYVVLYGLKKQG